MQTYQPYYPQMNNYNQQYNPQQPYMERLAGLQQFQQSLQAQQPQQPQQQFQQMPMGISGRVVPNAESIAANDVPMDGSVAFFPMQDMSQILAKSWNADGTIKTVIYKPFVETPSNLSTTNEKLNVGLSDDVAQAFMQRFDDIADRISRLEQSMTKPLAKTAASKTKKEAGEA